MNWFHVVAIIQKDKAEWPYVSCLSTESGGHTTARDEDV
jgi:hypothetical protein